MTALEDLLSCVSGAARCLPGAVELYLFGSAASPTTLDAYSDLDLHIITEHYTAIRKDFPGILALAGSIDLVYPLLDRPGECAFTIGFSEDSLYHKVDIGLSGRQESSFFNQVKDRVLLWRQPAQVEPILLGPSGAFTRSLERQSISSSASCSARYATQKRAGAGSISPAGAS